MKGEYALAEQSEYGGPNPRKINILKYLITIGVGLQLIAPGMVISYIGIASNKHEQYKNYTECSDDNIFDNGVQMFASVVCLTAIPGILLSIWLMRRLGRKVTIMLLNLPGIAGWFMLAFMDIYSLRLIGRCLTGISLGMAPHVCYTYIMETVPKDSKDKFKTAVIPCIGFGVSLAIILDALLCVKMTATAAVLISALALLIAIFLPESPVWLLINNRSEEAERALIRLRGGNGEIIKTEIQDIIQLEEKRQLIQDTKPFYERLFVMVFLFVFQQLSGTYIYLFYLREISYIVYLNALHAYEASVQLKTIISSLFLFVALTYRSYKGINNRRTLIVCSGIGLIFFHLVLFIFLMLFDNMKHLAMISRASSMGILIASAEGLIFLPWIMLADIFAENKKIIGGSISAIIGCILTFFTIYYFPIIYEITHNFGEIEGVFLLFSFACTAFSFRCVPNECETSGDDLNTNTLFTLDTIDIDDTINNEQTDNDNSNFRSK